MNSAWGAQRIGRRTDDGQPLIPRSSSSGYREKGRFEIPDKGQRSWAHPVISVAALMLPDAVGAEHE